MNVTQPTVTRLVEEGVAAQPVNQHMYAVVGLAQSADNCLSLSESVHINTWMSSYFLDMQCCLWDSWRVAGKKKFILYSMQYSPITVSVFLAAWLAAGNRSV